MDGYLPVGLGPHEGKRVRLRDYPELGEGTIRREWRMHGAVGGALMGVEIYWDDGEITEEEWRHVEVFD